MEEILQDLLQQWQYIARVIVAALCGSVIGLERSRRQKEAGIRTHIIVCLSSALFMIVSKYGFFDVLADYSETMKLDPSRVASSIVSGISFLGAGVIFLKGSSIRGLTTSAGLWATAACGMAIGSGMFALGIFTTVFVVLLQYLLHKYNLSSETIAATEIKITFDDKPDAISHIKDFFKQNEVEVEEYSIRKNTDKTITYTTVVKHLVADRVNRLSSIMEVIPEVREIDCNQ